MSTPVTVVEAVEANPRPGPADQAYVLLKKHFDVRDAKIATLKAEIAKLKEENKALRSAGTRPARLPKASPAHVPAPPTAASATAPETATTTATTTATASTPTPAKPRARKPKGPTREA